MFAYCGNNPICNSDPGGMWTVGLFLGVNLTLVFGVSVNIGFVFDGNGNFEWQWSYAVPGVNGTGSAGFISAGAGATLQFTEAENVYDLYGTSTTIGASGGAGWYVGGDIITFDNDIQEADFDGVQFTGGYGFGIDVHIGVSDTKKVGNVSPANSRGGILNSSSICISPPYRYNHALNRKWGS